MGTAKKNVMVAILGGLLIAGAGVGTAVATGAFTTLQVKVENGVKSFSTDEGKTWTQKAPENVSVNEENGKLTIGNGTPPTDGGNGELTKVKDGIVLHSANGGKTWSEIGKAPADEGASMLTKNENGAISFSTDGGKTWSAASPKN